VKPEFDAFSGSPWRDNRYYSTTQLEMTNVQVLTNAVIFLFVGHGNYP
jgi:hypothetical protein